MDRHLIFGPDKLNNVTAEFDRLSGAIAGITFAIWNEIPERYQRSYYENEHLINPFSETYQEWQAKLSLRQEPVFSVAFINDRVVSSVCRVGLLYEHTMNLWATNPAYRQRGIGKVVLLNFIKHCFENKPGLRIKALDITSPEVDNVLTDLGFV